MAEPAAPALLDPARVQRDLAAEGRVIVIMERGFDADAVARVMGSPLAACVVRKPEVYGINGTNFWVGGARDDEPMEVVQLPTPLADLVKNTHRSEREAEEERRRRTSTQLGGLLTTRHYS